MDVLQAVYTIQQALHIVDKLTGEPLSRNGSNDGAPHRSSQQPAATRLYMVTEWIHMMDHLPLVFILCAPEASLRYMWSYQR